MRYFILPALLLCSLATYSQDKAVRLAVVRMEVRGLQNGSMSNWTDTKDESEQYVTIDLTGKTVIWESKKAGEERQYTSYSIIDMKEDKRYGDLRLSILELTLKRGVGTIKYQMVFLNCGECTSYRLITNYGGDLQFRYLLSELD